MPLFLSKLQRGPTLKVMISILRIEADKSCMQTDIINVDDYVEVVLKFMCENNHLIPSIKMRKTAGAPSDSTIKILSGNFNKQFHCSDVWLVAAMAPMSSPKSLGTDVTYANRQYTLWNYSYYIEVNITVLLPSSIMILANCNLYEDTEFTDFELQGTDGKVAVHKIILMAQCDVFKSIMRGEWKEKAEGHMKIEGVTVQTLQHLKDYMYLGTLPDEGLDLLLVVAARYLMDKLISLCITKLVESMQPEDFDGLVKLACQHNIPGLVQALVFRIPDDVVNGIHQLKINDEELKDNDDSKDKDDSKNNEG